MENCRTAADFHHWCINGFSSFFLTLFIYLLRGNAETIYTKCNTHSDISNEHDN